MAVGGGGGGGGGGGVAEGGGRLDEKGICGVAEAVCLLLNIHMLLYELCV